MLIPEYMHLLEMPFVSFASVHGLCVSRWLHGRRGVVSEVEHFVVVQSMAQSIKLLHARTWLIFVFSQLDCWSASFLLFCMLGLFARNSRKAFFLLLRFYFSHILLYTKWQDNAFWNCVQTCLGSSSPAVVSAI